MKQFCILRFALYSSMAIVFHTASCNKKTADATATTASFENTPVEYPLSSFINEASGVADSKINPGYLWVEEDSGNPPQLYLLSHSGKIVKTIYIKGAVNRDWEDIALAAGPDASKKYLYVAEIGDNDAVHASSSFYRFEEPVAAIDTVRVFDNIQFTYPDGPRDAEALLVEDATKDIYIITKRDAKSRLYKIAYPYSTTALNMAVFIEELPYNGVTSAALSADGQGIIVKTYVQLLYYARGTGETIAQTLQKTYTPLGYQLEPQGEAVGFAQDNTGFYTLSEISTATKQSLYFYRKK